MKLNEIKKAVNQGKVVHWSNGNYQVVKENDDYVIKASNGHIIGLTWSDGKTLNGEEKDFFISDITEKQRKDLVNDLLRATSYRTFKEVRESPVKRRALIADISKKTGLSKKDVKEAIYNLLDKY